MTVNDVLPVLVAPFVGSFLGVLVRRLPRGEPVVLGRSHCEACLRPLRPQDLVPLLSALWLRGRCRYCGTPIAPMHWRIELAATAVAVVVVLLGGTPARLWAGCVLGWTLLALAAIDAGHFRLPDVLTLPLVVAGLGATLLLDPGDATSHAAAAALAYLLLRGLALAYRAWRGHEGLGAGDAKLFAAAGAWVGPEGLGNVLLLAALVGLGHALLGGLRGRKMTALTAIPFGPGLCLATWLVWLSQ